jgi:hypothetical protein
MPIKVDCGVDALHKYVLMPWAVKILFQSRMPRLLQWRTPSARCFLLLTMLECKEKFTYFRQQAILSEYRPRASGGGEVLAINVRLRSFYALLLLG